MHFALLKLTFPGLWTLQADKLLNICRTLSNQFLLVYFMLVAFVVLSLNLELLFTVCLQISPYSLVTALLVASVLRL